jgi:hypothetical protein
MEIWAAKKIERNLKLCTVTENDKREKERTILKKQNECVTRRKMRNEMK